MPKIPAYQTLDDAQWDLLIADFMRLADPCMLCPHACGVNRHSGETGFCGAKNTVRISSIFSHHGEEPPISGSKGSGTVFFSHCTLKCCFCQNYQISHEGEGSLFTSQELAEKFLWLESQGCHNINLVTATHYMPWVLPALRIAAAQGLSIPLVYNCSGYESVRAIHELPLLKQIVDIWLPDAKYGNPEPAQKFSGVSNYPTINQEALRAMIRASGPLKIDDAGIAYRGVLIRHLVLPNDLAGSRALAAFLSATFDPHDITISVMAQYQPRFRAQEHPELNRRCTQKEYADAVACFEDAGFDVYTQEYEDIDGGFLIDFTKRKNEALTDRRDNSLIAHPI